MGFLSAEKQQNKILKMYGLNQVHHGPIPKYLKNNYKNTYFNS